MTFGDYNGSGVIDAPDYVVWRKLLGQPNANLIADGNGNGQIDPGDYDVWRANFGRRVAGPQPEPPTSAAVPEPTSIVSLLIAISILLRRRIAAPCAQKAFAYRWGV
jgi:hypothetical protein